MVSRCRASFARTSGTTLMEVLMASTIFAIVMGSVVESVRSSTAVFESTQSDLDADRQARRMTQRLREVLENVRASSLDPPLPAAPVGGPTPFTADVRFQSIEGWGQGTASLSVEQRLFARIGQGEVENGIDDDGDGLIDELRVVHVPDAGAERPVELVVARNVLALHPGETADGTDENGNGLVDEPGFLVTEADGRLTVWIAAAFVDQDGSICVRTKRIATAAR